MLVLDLGGQYAQLIARRVRECRVYSELVGHGVTAEQVRARNPHALVLSGGPASVYAPGAPRVDPAIFELGIPTLGICYGMQLMALELGGAVERTGASEFGKTSMRADDSELLAGTPPEQTVWMSHRDAVTAPPEGARVVARSPTTPIAAFEEPALLRRHRRLAELGRVRPVDAAAELERHQLHAVADAERRNPEREQLRVDSRCALGVDRSRPAAEHEGPRVPRPRLRRRDAMRHEL